MKHPQLTKRASAQHHGHCRVHTSAHPKGDGLKCTEARELQTPCWHPGPLGEVVNTQLRGEPGATKEAVRTTAATLTAPGTTGRRQRAAGPGSLSLSHPWGAHDPTCTPFITSPSTQVLCLKGSPDTSKRAHRPDDNSGYGRSKAAKDPWWHKSRDKQGMEPPLLQRRWRLERANSQIQPREAAQVKRNQNLKWLRHLLEEIKLLLCHSTQLRNTWSNTTKTHSDTVPQKTATVLQKPKAWSLQFNC